MKTKYVLWVLFIGLFGWIGCDDDNDTLTPSDIAEFEFQFPQGNHDYDARIVDWFERTGAYMLYKFTSVDAYAGGISQWQEAYLDTTKTIAYYELSEYDRVEGDMVYYAGSAYKLGETKNSDFNWRVVGLDGRILSVTDYRVQYQGIYLLQEADERYIGQQLDFWEEAFLNNYSDSLLCALLPLKILLGRNLKLVDGSSMSVSDRSRYSFGTVLMFSYGDESIEMMTNARKKEIATYENYNFIRQNLNGIPLDEFYAVTDYTPFTSTQIPMDKCYELGFVRPTYWGMTIENLQNTDKTDFLDMICRVPYKKLIEEPEDDTFSLDCVGILHPKKDKNGLIREKYDIMVRVYKDHGIDLRAIGDSFSN